MGARGPSEKARKMKASICAKKVEDRTQFWMPVSSKSQDGKEDIRASVNVTLSNKARETFNLCVTDTKNPEIKIAHVDITDFWFKAVKGREHNIVILFINEMEEAKTETKPVKW